MDVLNNVICKELDTDKHTFFFILHFNTSLPYLKRYSIHLIICNHKNTFYSLYPLPPFYIWLNLQ